MEDLKAITQSLLMEMDKLELELHSNAIKNYMNVYQYESEFGGIPFSDFEEYVTEDGFEEQREVTIYLERCNKEIDDYFDSISKINSKKNLTPTEALERIRKIATPFNALNFYDDELKALKKDITKQIVYLNDMLDSPIERINRIKEIQEKDILNVEDFEIYFYYGKESQKKFRANKDYPLPIFSGKGNKVLYRKADVEKWFSRRDRHK